jgi:hypothetical protein
MTYTQLAVSSVVVAVLLDLFVLRTRLVGRRVFWVSYAIMFGFQLLTNGVLTGLKVVRYDGDVIIGNDSPAVGPPPMFGQGRIAFAPVEDLMFGFGLILLTLSTWIWLGRRGLQREPVAGPPLWRRGVPRTAARDQDATATGAARAGGTDPEP